MLVLMVLGGLILIGTMRLLGLPPASTPNFTLAPDERAVIHTKMLEVENLELKMQPIQQQHQQLVDQLNQLVVAAYEKHKLDQKKFDLNIQSWSFVPHVERAQPTPTPAPTK
jgi:hypothetical protein